MVEGFWIFLEGGQIKVLEGAKRTINDFYESRNAEIAYSRNTLSDLYHHGKMCQLAFVSEIS